jgi:hypothetical protein
MRRNFDARISLTHAGPAGAEPAKPCARTEWIFKDMRDDIKAVVVEQPAKSGFRQAGVVQ